jgi:hypothetical protein
MDLDTEFSHDVSGELNIVSLIRLFNSESFWNSPKPICSMYGKFTYKSWLFFGQMLVNIPAPWSLWESGFDFRHRIQEFLAQSYWIPPDLLPRFALWRPFIYIIYWYQPGCTGCQDGILQHSPTGYIHIHMSSLLLQSPAICSSTNSRFSPTGKCAMVCTSNYNPW